MLDQGLSVAAGLDWQGYKVRRGLVVYVLAEAPWPVSRRVSAWTMARAVTLPEEFFLVMGPVQLLQHRQVEEFVQQIEEVVGGEPQLIVFDTLAGCLVGGDENSAKDMGTAVENCRYITRENGATVLLVHHSAKGNDKPERGSSALRGAADFMIRLRRGKDGVITLVNDKQRDAEQFPPINLSLRTVEIGRDPGTGQPINSLVVAGAGAPLVAAASGKRLASSLQRAAGALAGLDGDGSGHTGAVWRKAITGASDGVKLRTFQNWRQSLIRLGLVEEVPGTNPPRYRLTEKGRATTRS